LGIISITYLRNVNWQNKQVWVNHCVLFSWERPLLPSVF
jgi:hypothetical protein